MTEDQAEHVVAVLASGWPHAEISALSVGVWVSKLLPLDYETVLAVIGGPGGLLERSRFLPTVADVYEAYGQMRRRAELERRQLPGPPVDREKCRRNVARLRAELSKIGRRLPG